MDTCFSIPFPQGGEDVIRNFFEAWPIQILLFGKVLLIAMLAAKVTVIGHVPLNIEGLIHGLENFLFI
jgi:hypothetical protein